MAGTAPGTATTLNSGTGSDTVNVQGTEGPTAVNTGNGSNVVHVGSLMPTTGGIVDNLRGALTVLGSGGDTMNVDDTGSTGTKSGTLTATTLTGLGMGPGGITYAGISLLNLRLGSGGETGNALSVNVPAGQDLPATTNLHGGSAGKDTLSASWAQDFNGTLNVSGFATSSLAVGADFNGALTASNPGTISSVAIGGSLTASGLLRVTNPSDSATPTAPTGLLGNIGTMTVGGSIAGQVQVLRNVTTLNVGNALSGQVLGGGQLTSASVTGNVSGSIKQTLAIDTLYIGGSLTPSGLISAVNTGNPALGNINTLTIGQGLAGTVLASGTRGNLRLLNGSIAPTASITLGNLASLIVGPDELRVGQNMAGTLTVTVDLGRLPVAGGIPGWIKAGHVRTMAAYGGFGPVVLRVTEDGIERRVELADPAVPYPLPDLATVAGSPYVNVQFLYKGALPGSSGTLANPQLTARPTTNISTARDQYDLSLVTYHNAAKFNLARLDAAGIAGVRNVAVEGDILTAVSGLAAAFIRIGGAPDDNPAGVWLPRDHRAGVGVRDFFPTSSVRAPGIRGWRSARIPTEGASW